MSKRITSQNTKLYAKEEKKMIVMNLELDNFFAFKNFQMNMSYPKKIVNSYIQGEFLKERTNFRYKKVNVIMGANATGKTTIGRMLMSIFNFIDKKESFHIVNKIEDNNETATFSIDFVTNKYILYRIDVKVLPEDEENRVVLVSVRNVDINKNDNYETCIERLLHAPLNYKENYVDELSKIEKLGWMFTYPEDSSNGRVKCSDKVDYPMILNCTLKALDPAIKEVEKINEVENSYVIRMEKRDLIIQDGEVIKNNVLSSGTKAGIDIARLISAIRCGEYGFFYCDEKFSYVHSDVEKAFLGLMINSLRDNDQFFFTTHNTDILDMPLPKHTYTILRKDPHNIEKPIDCVEPAKYLKRNTDSLRNAVENDLFSSAPDLENIFEIENI